MTVAALRRILPAVVLGTTLAMAFGAAPALAAEEADDVAAKAAARQNELAEQIRQRAEQQLEETQAALAAAQRMSTALRRKAEGAKGDADQARRDLGNFARQAYATGPMDIVGLATLVGSPDPAATMRRAEMAKLVAEHQDAQWDDALAVADRAQALIKQADQVVADAKARVATAQRIVDTMNHKRNIQREISLGSEGQNGAAELAQRCLEAEVVVDLCAQPPWTEENLTFDSVVISRTVYTLFPQIEIVGGWRPSDPYPDHPSGRASDIMVPDGGKSKAGVAVGDRIAAYFQKHADEYGIYYMIWRQRIWKAGEPIGQWSSMSDRGAWSANHMDHVHITVTNGTSGTAFDQALLKAQDLNKSLS